MKRVYRVRNLPGNSVIPAEWKSSTEQFLSVYIARCPENNQCDWIETVKIRGTHTTGKTELTYGLNKDEFKETTTAFVWDKPEESRVIGERPHIVSGIKGRLATSDGVNEFDVALTLVSEMVGNDFRYSAYSREGSQPLVLVGSKKSEALQLDGVCVFWEAASGPHLAHQLVEPHPIIVGKPEPRTDILIKIDGEAKLNDGVAILYYKGKEFARFSAPAFRSVVE